MMLTHLMDRCRGGHSHTECRGRDCEASEDYTPAVIDAIHAGFRLRCGPSDEEIVGQSAAHMLSPADLSVSCVEHHMFEAAKHRRPFVGKSDESHTHCSSGGVRLALTSGRA
jgi:hypothetical protein